MENHTSFDEIYDQLFPIIYRFVRLKIPVSDVEDVTSEIMAKIWRFLPGFEGKSSIRSWALKIAFNQVADFYRVRKNIVVFPLNDEVSELSITTDPSEKLAEVSAVEQALNSLTEIQISAIQLRLIEGFSSIEVAQILKTTPQAVDSLLYRAKKSFRQAYADYTQEVKGLD